MGNRQQTVARLSSTTKKRIEICILAGGLSSRMGRDKAALRLGNRTMLSMVRSAARISGYAVRVIRRDVVPRCGPLGGVLTGLMTSSAERVVFLACDMPFVTAELLIHVINKTRSDRALFIAKQSKVGFPFVLPTSARELVSKQIEKGELSLHELARRLGAEKLKVPQKFSGELENVNTPAKYQWARKRNSRFSSLF